MNASLVFQLKTKKVAYLSLPTCIDFVEKYGICQFFCGGFRPVTGYILLERETERTTFDEKAKVVERGKMRKGAIALALRTLSLFVEPAGIFRTFYWNI